MAAKAHPDKGGDVRDSARLHAARDEWRKAQADNPGKGRPAAKPAAKATASAAKAVAKAAAAPQQASASASVPGAEQAVALPRKSYRVRGEAVLLTYQGLPALALEQWARFRAWVKRNKQAWKCKAAAFARGFRRVCQEVLRKKGARARG